MQTRREFMTTCACGVAAACGGCISATERKQTMTDSKTIPTGTAPDLKYVTYCGLYCRHCDVYRTDVARHAAALHAALQRQASEPTKPGVTLPSEEFLAVLSEMGAQNREGKCRGCRGGCGDPDCGIRRCARAKHVDLCSSCGDFPCEKFQGLARTYPNVIGDGTRQKAVGVEKWIGEQEQRYRAGFSFGDLRNPA